MRLFKWSVYTHGRKTIIVVSKTPIGVVDGSFIYSCGNVEWLVFVQNPTSFIHKKLWG